MAERDPSKPYCTCEKLGQPCGYGAPDLSKGEGAGMGLWVHAAGDNCRKPAKMAYEVALQRVAEELSGVAASPLTKTCNRCLRELPTTSFYTQGPGRLYPCCKACKREEARLAYRAHPRSPEVVKLRRYGLTVDDYDRMLDAQGGACAICRQVCPVNAVLSVDHDHSTETVRGLLCHHCNVALGRLQDSPELAEQAAAYLRVAATHATGTVPVEHRDRSNNMPRRPQPVAATPTVLLGIYGTGESSKENTVALLDELIEGLGEITPVFLVPLGKVLLTDAVADVIAYALDKGYQYEAVHAEPVGRAKALKEASEAAAKLAKVEDVAQEFLDRLVKAREARLLFFWNDDDAANEDEQRLLNAVLAANVVALDVAQGMEPIAPDDAPESDGSAEDPEAVAAEPDGGTPEAEAEAPAATEAAEKPATKELEPEDPEDPPYDVAKTWPLRRLKEFALSIGYTDDGEDNDLDKAIKENGSTVTNATSILQLLYPDEVAAAGDAAPAAEPVKEESGTPARARQIREEIEADGGKPNQAHVAALKANAPDEAQTQIGDAQGIQAAAGRVIAEIVAESLADLVLDKVIERLQARAKEADKNDIVRELVPPRRPGRPRNAGDE